MWSALFGDPTFRRLWAMGATTNIMRWLETVALGFFVYELTGSPFWVAFVGLVRMLPMFVLGAFVGVIADRIDRRLLLMAGTALLTITYAILAALAITGPHTVVARCDRRVPGWSRVGDRLPGAAFDDR